MLSSSHHPGFSRWGAPKGNVHNEKEDRIFVYAYDPSRKGNDYYLGYFKPYDASTLIDMGQKELEHYK